MTSRSNLSYEQVDYAAMVDEIEYWKQRVDTLRQEINLAGHDLSEMGLQLQFDQDQEDLDISEAHIRHKHVEIARLIGDLRVARHMLRDAGPRKGQ